MNVYQNQIIDPLAELSQCMLDPADGLVVFVVDVLQDGERADFPDNPGEQPLGVFRIVAYEHELVAQLGKHGFRPFPRFGEGPEGRFSVSLVFSAGCFQPDTGRFEKVKPHLDADMALVPEEGAVRVAGLDILQVMEVVYARLGQAGRVDAPVQPADGVQLVSVEKGALCGAVFVGGGFPRVLPAHRAASGTCHPACRYRHGIDAETILAAIHLPGHPLMDALAEQGRGLAPVVVLPAG